MSRPFILTPSLAERNRRWRAVRKAMELAGIDCLVAWGNGSQWGRGSSSLRYLSGIGANETLGLCIFPLEGDPTVLTWHPAIAPWWRKAQNWVYDVRGRTETGWTPTLIDTIRGLGLPKPRIGLVDMVDSQAFTSFLEKDRLMAGLPEAEFLDASKLVADLRMIKSEEEIRLLSVAGQLVDEMFEAALATVRPGVRENHVYAAIVNALLEGGGEYPEMILWDAARYPNVHPGRTPTSRQLKRGDVISIELHSKYGGYLGHGERCIFLGEPDSRYKRIHEVSRESYDSAFELLRPGTDLIELAEAFYCPVKKAGMGVTELGVHGHGLSSGEFPTFLAFPFHYPGADKPPSFKLKANMVFGVTVDLFDPKFKSGKTGLVLADTVLVTKHGPRRLCRLGFDPLVVH